MPFDRLAGTEQHSDAWRRARQRGLGGSDAAAALGLNPWKSRRALWEEKVAAEPIEATETPAMHFGTVLEPIVRAEYERTTGRSIRLEPNILASRERPFMLASLDGMTDDGWIFEAKTSRRGVDWGDPETDDIPLRYLAQIAHYMAVVEAPAAEVAVLIGGQDFRIYHVQADRELQAYMVAAEASFWRLVETREPPPIETVRDATRIYGEFGVAGVVAATEKVMEAVMMLCEIRERRTTLDAEWDREAATVMAALGDHGDVLTGPDGAPLATWELEAPRTRFNLSAFRKAHPELARQFRKTEPASRRFLLKDIA